jgi:ELWxxDGT repeat protein
VVHGGKLYFSAGPSPDYELWTSDGTAAGTSRVLDIWPGSTGSSPYALTSFDGYLWFAANTAARGTELWRSDGTAAGTVLIGTLDAINNTGPTANGGSNRTRFAASSDLLCYRAFTSVRGYELWAARKDTTIRPVGQGCGAPLGAPHRVPAMRSDDSIVGGTMTITIDEAYPGATAFLLIGGQATSPIAFPRSGCDIWIDPALLLVAASWTVTSSTTGTSLAVPADPGLAGGKFALQAICSPTNAPFAIDWSNALHATVRP